MHKHRFGVMLKGPIGSLDAAITPWGVSFGPRHVDGMGAAVLLEGAGKFRAAVMCQRTGLANALCVFLECVKRVAFGADRCQMYVAGARIYKDSDVFLLAKRFLRVGAVQIYVDAGRVSMQREAHRAAVRMSEAFQRVASSCKCGRGMRVEG